MTFYLRRAILTLTVLLALASSGWAQIITCNTTLVSAITASQTTIPLTSITCTSPAPTPVDGSLIYVDAELMQLNGTPSAAASVRVNRGWLGTVPAAHASAAVVYLGPAGNPSPFHTSDPAWGATCVRNQQAYSPWINYQTGITWQCGYNGNSTTSALNWRSFSAVLARTYNSPTLGRFDQPTAPWLTPVLHDLAGLIDAVRGWVGAS